MLYSAISDISNSTSRLGLKRMICRHSSEPIEPPAPVTSTHLPRMHEPNSRGFGGTGSRPSRSLDVDVAQLADLRLAGDQVGQIGERLHVHAERLELRENLAPAPARGGRHRQQHPVDAVLPHQLAAGQSESYTRMPLMLLPCSDFLSSMKATGLEVRSAEQH